MTTTTTSATTKSGRWAPIPDVDKLTILKLLADGRSPAFVATATKYTEERVRQISAAHGYPDLAKLAWAVDVVTESIEEAERERVTQPGVTPQPRSPRVAPVPRAKAEPQPAARPAATEPTEQKEPSTAAAESDSVRGLIARGAKSQRARIQGLAAKAGAAIDALERALQAEEEARRAAAEAAQAKARARAARVAEERKIREELAELERRRAELRQRLHPTRSSRPAPAPRDIDPKKVRQWARTNGVDVPDVGRIPVRVVEQYLAASNKAA